MNSKQKFIESYPGVDFTKRVKITTCSEKQIFGELVGVMNYIGSKAVSFKNVQCAFAHIECSSSKTVEMHLSVIKKIENV